VSCRGFNSLKALPASDLTTPSQRPTLPQFETPFASLLLRNSETAKLRRASAAHHPTQRPSLSLFASTRHSAHLKRPQASSTCLQVPQVSSSVFCQRLYLSPPASSGLGLVEKSIFASLDQPPPPRVAFHSRSLCPSSSSSPPSPSAASSPSLPQILDRPLILQGTVVCYRASSPISPLPSASTNVPLNTLRPSSPTLDASVQNGSLQRGRIALQSHKHHR
jgi:hypothetical protein